MNQFASLLYADGAAHSESAFTPRTDDSALHDLHINLLISEITKGYEEYGLGDLYGRKPKHRRDAEFRLDAARDLWDDAVRAEIVRYIGGFSTAGRYLRTSESIHTSPVREKWKLDAAAAYVGTIDEMCARAGPEFKSEALNRFFGWARDYAQSAPYRRLRARALSLAASIGAISYSLDLDIGRNIVVIGEDGGGGDVCAGLADTFARYDLRGVSREIAAFADVNLNILELKFMEYLLAKNPGVQPALMEFSAEFGGFIHENIPLFEYEARFYISYIQFAKSLGEKGFAFSIPEFSADGGLHITGGFDASLALLRGSADEIVENDFHIGGGERSFLLTGPNQGGKTTFARMFGQCVFFACLGLPVPCREAKILWPGAIKTHFNIEESPGEDTGRLKEELTRLKRIVASAPENSVIILNELFSSATTYDALEMAVRVIRMLEGKDCVCLYITHLYELADAGGAVSLIAEMADGDPPACTYRIRRSGAQKSALAGKLLAARRLRAEDIKERIDAAVAAVR